MYDVCLSMNFLMIYRVKALRVNRKLQIQTLLEAWLGLGTKPCYKAPRLNMKKR